MLKIFNDLEPFFHDNYRRISVREFARIRKISPPSASSMLQKYHKDGLLNREEERRFIYFSANREENIFIALMRVYWHIQFKRIGLLNHIKREFVEPIVILFGSFSKAEVTSQSDIDIAIISRKSNKINFSTYEKKLGRTISVFLFRDLGESEIENNLLNGYILMGSW